ncbi:MAG: hypothetical protein J6A59_10480 [Lachnospiraceae bacterium]|nr:hypothetical protein [Lachnospiraceae bacterium]
MYRFMDKDEIEIRQMDGLKMIHLYKLGGSDAIAAYYGDNQQINMCAMDKQYNLLMERVLTLYSQCEDKNSIIVDDAAKKLLQAAVGRGDNYTNFFNRVGKRYKDMEGLEAPRFAADGAMRETMIPMLQYYIKELYNLWDVNVDFDRNTRGWHRNCVLKLKKGMDTLLLPVKMEFQETNACTARVGNFLQDMSTLEFSVTYADNRQLIVFECSELALVGENRIDIDGDGLKSVTTISVNGQTVYYMDDAVPMVEIGAEGATFKNLPKYADIDVANSKVYQLPWGGYVVCRVTEEKDEATKRTDYDTIFIESHDTKVSVRHFSYGLVENLADGLKLRTDGANMRKLYYGDKHGELETLFIPVGYYSGWDYKEFLENKYFYENMEEDR